MGEGNETKLGKCLQLHSFKLHPCESAWWRVVRLALIKVAGVAVAAHGWVLPWLVDLQSSQLREWQALLFVVFCSLAPLLAYFLNPQAVYLGSSGDFSLSI